MKIIYFHWFIQNEPLKKDSFRIKGVKGLKRYF